MKPFKNPLRKSTFAGLAALVFVGASLSGCIVAEPRGGHRYYADNNFHAPQQHWQRGGQNWQGGNDNGHYH